MTQKIHVHNIRGQLKYFKEKDMKIHKINKYIMNVSSNPNNTMCHVFIWCVMKFGILCISRWQLKVVLNYGGKLA